jgi:hypothetical protein
MARIIKLTRSESSQLAVYLNNLASAWFIAGIITPIFILDNFTFATFYRAILGVMMSSIFLLVSLRYGRSR